MSNYILDFTKTRWMVSNPKRLHRTGMDGKAFRCPFCPGNEKDTPPEVYRSGEGEKDCPGWSVRVVPNLFAITDIHEVIIHSPDHNKNFDDFDISQAELIMNAYIERYRALKCRGKVFIFHNFSLVSGASLIHPHSQIAVVPDEIPTNTLAFQPIENIIEQNNSFVSYCPTYSEWAYEVWIASRYMEHVTCNFEELKKEEVESLAEILQSTIIKLKKVHNAHPHYSKKQFGYNFYIYIPQNEETNIVGANFYHTRVSPSESEGSLESKKIAHDSKNMWYLRIIPRFMERAGFELSTGIMVNSVEAKMASIELKKIV